ncbi:aminoglycoside 6'-N-acetyltransferase [Methyloceanibacter sp.]|uniref:aminoglycoside 6'-N-acetyltransferase n=1 Tax=Methyloceanibacter sp. TaxID=1965321 RepID=UPI003D6D9565
MERCTSESLAAWVRLRQDLWPHASERELRPEAAALLARPNDAVAFIMWGEQSAAIAFAEATLRRDYVNGCSTCPVAFLEGIYVDPSWRGPGAARLLCNAIEDWAAGLGCTELASDVVLHNDASQKAHEALGFEETERVVYYRKRLSR